MRTSQTGGGVAAPARCILAALAPPRPYPFATRPRRPRARTVRGFAFITALFLMVTLAAFALFVVSLLGNAATTSAIAVQGARGYEAAKSGLEWATFQLKDPRGTLRAGPTTLPDCTALPAGLSLPTGLSDFSVSFACERFPAIGTTPGYHEEGRRRIVTFLITATASSGSAGSADAVERKLEARIEVCKDPDAAAPGYNCP